MKKFLIIFAAMLTVSSAAFMIGRITSGDTVESIADVFENIVIDVDGNVYECDTPGNGRYRVYYNTNGTADRTDDVPVRFEEISESESIDGWYNVHYTDGKLDRIEKSYDLFEYETIWIK